MPRPRPLLEPVPGRLYDATWGRIFSACYDRFMSASEEAGMREDRHALLAAASGRTIELGAGTGLNLQHYPDAVSELVLTEPDPHMVAKLKKRVAQTARRVEVYPASADRLPFADRDFDTAVLTLVLCTVPDQDATLREVARVLKPSGRLLFIEHVRSGNPKLARWQDRLETPWRWFGDGCHCNRETLSAMEASPLKVEEVQHGEIRKAIPLVRPKITGSARRVA